MPLTAQQKRRFRAIVRRFYASHGRQLPWRETRDPYAILVSELMLQQTQVDRVIPKYEQFLQQFPTVERLHAAPLQAVLLAWQGLGYNRRALFLKKAATAIAEQHGGQLPNTVATLEDLPGIGPYTARAVATFAYNQPHVLIETNIRAVYLHTFFAGHDKVADAALLPLIEQTLDRRRPREWYAALMDYGSYLKKTQPNPSRRSAHHTRQKSFANSNRQLRGRIVATLTQATTHTAAQLAATTGFPLPRVRDAAAALVREGLIQKSGRTYHT